MNIFKNQCMCGIEFKQRKNLYAHMRKLHNIEPFQQQIKAENYICDFCGRKFVCQSSIIRHLRRTHSDSNNKLIGVNKKANLTCPHGKCSINFRTYEVLREHLAKKHDFQLEFEELSFSSIEDFNQWKDSMQLQTASLYTQSTSGRNLRIELGRRLYYNCHRSNVYKQRGNNVRAIKSLGSNKIGKACPSRLEVTYTLYAEQMIIKVKFWKTHCGHTNQVERLPLNRQMKCSIAEKLKNGYSFKQVFQWIRDTRNQDGVSERLQLVTEKDLYNIIREYNIENVKNKRTTKNNYNYKVDKNNISMISDPKNIISEVIDIEYQPSTSISDNNISLLIDNKNDITYSIDYSKNNISTTNASKHNIPTTSDSKNNISCAKSNSKNNISCAKSNSKNNITCAKSNSKNNISCAESNIKNNIFRTKISKSSTFTTTDSKNNILCAESNIKNNIFRTKASKSNISTISNSKNDIISTKSNSESNVNIISNELVCKAEFIPKAEKVTYDDQDSVHEE
ncbi:metacaspase-2-like [Maniola hyperantus]|uniref:metacaspase-2-like n=1 Tax=Aphantopus hyperantus TaxID=2795564 RepID=UPI00374A387E